MEYCIGANIDWTRTREVITSVVSIIGAVLAILGYVTWRRQIIGKTEHDTAKNALLSALRVREAIRQIRKPGAVVVTEQQAADISPNDIAYTPAQLALRSLERVYSDRVHRLGERWVELELATLEAETLWGKEATECVSALDERVREISAGVWDYFWLRGLYANGSKVDANPERVRENGRLLFDFSTSQKKDSFTQTVDSAITKIELFYRPRLRLRTVFCHRRRWTVGAPFNPS